MRLNPTNPVYQRNLGNALYGSGDFMSAVAAYRTSLQQHEDPQTEEALGMALARLEDWPGAAAAFRAALKARPDWGEAHLNLSDALAKQNDFVGAVTEAQSDSPPDPQSS